MPKKDGEIPTTTVSRLKGQPERSDIRAIIYSGLPLDEQTRIQNIFHGTAFSNASLEEMLERKVVIACSYVDAYEMVMRKKCELSGPSAETLVEILLEEAGYDVRIVTREVFREMNQRQT